MPALSFSCSNASSNRSTTLIGQTTFYHLLQIIHAVWYHTTVRKIGYWARLISSVNIRAEKIPRICHSQNDSPFFLAPQLLEMRLIAAAWLQHPLLCKSRPSLFSRRHVELMQAKLDFRDHECNVYKGAKPERTGVCVHNSNRGCPG